MIPLQKILPSTAKCYCGNTNCLVAYGYCHCGCGKKTKTVTENNARLGLCKGNPCKFMRGHTTKGTKLSLEKRKKKSESQTRHGHAGDVFFGNSKTYRAWASMLKRCQPNFKQAKDYFARGIVVCDRWRGSFDAFLEDMREAPIGLTLDRINNEGNYESGNCRWASRKKQMNNTRRNIIVSYQGASMTLQELVEMVKLPRTTLYYRIKRGLSAEEAVNLSNRS